MRARNSLFRRFTDTNVSDTGSVKTMEQNSPRNILGYRPTDIFYSLEEEADG